MNESIPVGWSMDSLGKYFSESVAGEWGKEANGDENDIPVLRATNFSQSGAIDYSKLAIRNIEEKKRIKKSLTHGDIVLEKSGGSPTQPVGRVIYFQNNKPFLYSNFTQKLSPVDSCDSKFIFFKLYYEYGKKTVLKFQQQTTGIINFQLAEYLLYKSTFPPLPEQQKIASILTSVDEVIEKTEAQTSKLQDLKKGMMQELLTKGIGHTEFKDSPVGRIPKEWEVATLSELVNHESPICYGILMPGQFVLGGVPVIKVKDIKDNQINQNNLLLTAKDIDEKYSRSRLNENDLLLTIRGTTGRMAVVPSSLSGANITQDTARIRIKNKELSSFVFMSLQGPLAQQQIELHTIGQAVKGINLAEVRKLKIALPTKNEANLITLSISSLDQRLQTAFSNLTQTKALKKALMQDLLTGKVRVKTD